MPFTLTRERKIILIGGAALLFLGLIYNLAPTVREIMADNESIGLKEQKLARYMAKIEEQTSLVKQQKVLGDRLRRIESRLLTPTTPSLAAVDIQTMIRDIAVRHGAEIKTMRILAVEGATDQAYDTIPVEVTVSSTIRQLTEVLYDIKTSSRILHVREMTARSAGGRRGDTVLTTMTIEGFMKKGSPEGRSPKKG